MRCLLLIIFSLISSNLFSQDLKEIEHHLNFTLQKNASNYRGLKLTIYFEKKDGLWNINTQPNSVLDHSILEQIKLYFCDHVKDITLSKLRAYVKFDDYSSDIFVNVIDVGRGEELFNPIFLHQEPINGIIGLVNRWYLHLDSCIDWSLQKEISYVSFLVEKNGELVPLRSGKYDDVFYTFLKNEKKWFPGILNGRPLKTKISLLIPSNIKVIRSIVIKSNEKTLFQLNSNITNNAIIQDICSFWNDSVYVSDKPILRCGLNLVSFVLDKGNYVSPIIHQGDLNVCNKLIQEVISQNYKYYFDRLGVHQFDRIYFYTYNE